jgi:hypothetical protein
MGNQKPPSGTVWRDIRSIDVYGVSIEDSFLRGEDDYEWGKNYK